jgi:hypothetical protein
VHYVTDGRLTDPGSGGTRHGDILGADAPVDAPRAASDRIP